YRCFSCLTVSNGDGSFGPPGLRIGTPTAVGISRYTPCWSMQPAERVEHDPHLSPQNPNRRSRRCLTQHTCHPWRDTHLDFTGDPPRPRQSPTSLLRDLAGVGREDRVE